MANLWDSLGEEERVALVNAHVAGNGGKTPENISRAREQLSQNPNLVERLAKETGITQGEEVSQDEEDVAEASDIDAAVDASLEETGDVQEPGTITKTANASLEERVRRLEEENRRLRGQ
jgi:hypothetical protein